jgi:tetratricopeptide (TPR) repeat protein
MAWNRGLSDLQGALAVLYPSEGDMRRLVNQAELPSTFVDFDGAAIRVWHNILIEAERRGRVQALIENARMEYPENEALQLAAAAYQTGKTGEQLQTVQKGKESNKLSSPRKLPLPVWISLFGAMAIIAVVLIFLRPDDNSPPAAPPAVTLTSQTNGLTTEPAAVSTIPETPTTTGQPTPESVDVLISQFRPRGNVPNLDIAARLERDLDRKLQDYNLADVRVAVIQQPATNREEARALAQIRQSKIVIYGWYDEGGVAVNIYLVDEGSGGRTIPGTHDLPLESTDGNETKFVFRDVLPENVSFLSLFIIGQLNYLANNYQAGHTAFDAAMENIPETVALENKALIPFFTARQLDASGSTDSTAIVCDYVNAITLDQRMAAAYNNLGTVLVRHYTVPVLQEQPSPLTDEAFACLAQIGYGRDNLGTLTPGMLFAKALELEPTSALAAYNRVSFAWGYPGFSATPSDEIKEQLTAVIDLDPTIWGASLILGNLAFEEQDFVTAAAWYSQTLAVAPAPAEVRMNLGQAYLQQGAVAQAETQFQEALRIEPALRDEAQLALAHLAYRRADPTAALTHLAEVAAPQAEVSRLTAAAAMAVLLKAKLLIDQHDLAGAIDTLETLAGLTTDTALIQYLLGMLYSELEDTTRRTAAWQELSTSFFLPSRSHLFYQNATVALTWRTLVEHCGLPDADDFTQWHTGDSPCLPAAFEERMDEVYEHFLDWLAARLSYQRGVPELNLGQACPYVFTRSSDQDHWQVDTTILYMLSGAAQERIQQRPLARFNGQLLIQELEPEISYIDFLFVLVEDEAGQLVRLLPKAEEPATTLNLQQADNQYTVLTTGESLLLSFDGYALVRNPQRVWVVAEGYYVPTYQAGERQIR